MRKECLYVDHMSDSFIWSGSAWLGHKNRILPDLCLCLRSHVFIGEFDSDETVCRESLCDSGPCSNNVCTLCRSSCYFLSRISSKNIKKTSHFLDPGMCVICVEILPFQWRIPFHSLHFSGHKPIVWSLADCLINEPFLLLFFGRTHRKREKSFMKRASLVEQVMPQPNYFSKQKRKKVYWTNWRRI